MTTNAIQIFNFNSNTIRVIERDGEPWWVAKDVCDVLGLGTTAKAVEGLDSDEKGMSIVHTLGGNQPMTIINEPGLYSLILRSRKPEAKAFKRWITHEVIPAIRKHGGYIVSSPDDSDTAIMARGYQAALIALERKDQTIAKLKADKAKTEQFTSLGRAVCDSGDYMLISKAAVIMAQADCKFTIQETGERRIIGSQYLRLYLEHKGFIVKRGRSDAGRPTVKGQKYKIRMKASRLITGHVGYTPTLSPDFVKTLIYMFHEKDIRLPKITKKRQTEQADPSFEDLFH